MTYATTNYSHRLVFASAYGHHNDQLVGTMSECRDDLARILGTFRHSRNYVISYNGPADYDLTDSDDAVLTGPCAGRYFIAQLPMRECRECGCEYYADDSCQCMNDDAMEDDTE